MTPRSWVSILLPLSVGTAGAQTSVFTFEDMLEVRTFASGQLVALSSTGTWLAYVVTDTEDEWNILEPRPTGHLYVEPLQKNGAARALTEGAVHGSFPVWSPGGERLAFFREEESRGQLTLWDAGSGGLTPLGDSFTGRSYLPPQWASGGTRLVFAAAVKNEDAGPTPRVRVVESTDARIPGDDFFVDHRRAALFVADIASGSVAPLFSEPALLRSFRLSSDGRSVLYSIPNPETFGVIGKEKNETFRVPLSGGPPEAVSPEDDRLWSPDRRHYLRLVPDPKVQDLEVETPLPDMYTIARPFMDLHLGFAEGGEEQNLTSGFPDQVSDPIWGPEARHLFFKTTHNETYDEAIYRYSLDDGRLKRLAGGARRDLEIVGVQRLRVAEHDVLQRRSRGGEPLLHTRARRRLSRVLCSPLWSGNRLKQPLPIPLLFCHVVFDELVRIVVELRGNLFSHVAHGLNAFIVVLHRPLPVALEASRAPARTSLASC